MRITYRTTSIFVLGTLLLLVASALFPALQQTQITPGTQARWNPCMAWVNYGSMHNLMAFVCSGAFIVASHKGGETVPDRGGWRLQACSP